MASNSNLNAFQADAFQNDAFQMLSATSNQALVSIFEAALVYASVSIVETAPSFANMATITPGSSSPSTYANVSVWES